MEKKELNFRLLKAEEIECRVNVINEKGFSLLLYKHARCDMNILDETVGSLGWARDHKELKGNMYCGITIDGVTKWDCGSESYSEKEKGEASDSFKRAAVNWGIGRELYTAPFIYVRGNVKEVKKDKYAPDFRNITVREIEYNDKREISYICIDGDGSEIFYFGEKKDDTSLNLPPREKKSVRVVESARRLNIRAKQEDTGCPNGEIINFMQAVGKTNYDDLSELEFSDLLKMVGAWKR